MSEDRDQNRPRTAEEVWKQIHNGYVIPPPVSPRSRRMVIDRSSNADIHPPDSQSNYIHRERETHAETENTNTPRAERLHRSASSVWGDIYAGYGPDYRSASMEDISPRHETSHTPCTPHPTSSTYSRSSKPLESTTEGSPPRVTRPNWTVSDIDTDYAGSIQSRSRFRHPRANVLSIVVPGTADSPTLTSQSRAPSPEEELDPVNPLFHGQRALSQVVTPPPQGISPATGRQPHPRSLVRRGTYETIGSRKGIYFDVELQRWRVIPDRVDDEDENEGEGEGDPKRGKKRHKLKDLGKSIIQNLKDIRKKDGDKDNDSKRLSVMSISSPLGTSRSG